MVMPAVGWLVHCVVGMVDGQLGFEARRLGLGLGGLRFLLRVCKSGGKSPGACEQMVDEGP
jgi:hypothetical protein